MPEKNVQVNTDRGLPYERFLQFGPENLTEAELLAVILRTGTKEDSAVALAEKVLALATYPREGLLGLHDVSVEELMEIRGIGMVKAVKLKCIAELSNRMSRAKAREGICFTPVSPALSVSFSAGVCLPAQPVASPRHRARVRILARNFFMGFTSRFDFLLKAQKKYVPCSTYRI